jgi:LPXTG-site transpeptidase (sortase) family protein
VEVRGPNGAVVRAAENNQARRGYHWRVSDTSSPKLDELPLAAPAPGGCSTPLVAAAPIAAPDWLEIPTAHISAPLVELGVDAQGAMEAPPTPDVVGWYRMSARAGQPGNAVLSGHVDWGQNTAVFWGLRDLQPADVILLRGADGVEHTYKVAWNRVFSRTDASATELVHGSNGAVLTLITCDGVYDRSIREYSDRRIVRAVLSN